ncbi:glycosyltransferase family 2 protein [Phormidesmis priestleyi ULC007]|uniref:Glycosyltransferase family 2 protein n=1 Tax=Phormidesmis priestleyi ULC007 TaxID=1920490 RepID=A0A2T1D563_9CYAN|nr:glycosyltransferase family 2 protein [Phormidesmis priestleyi]PSB15643.1 glycosyltransferase family 2 protein [Phormidesmis priestleyi ULC007]
MNSLDNITDLHLDISVCICTRNRPEDLSKALKSVEGSTYPAFEVIVSDDSTNDETKNLVVFQFPKVKYLEGPRKGLGANRNNALKTVRGSHVLFIDDDVVLNENFLEIVCNRLAKYAEQESIDNVIISGIENKNGQLIFPGEQSFLGYQNVSYKEGDRIRTVVINSAVFPFALFRHILFDEKLVYGNDEVDLTTRATQKGYKVILCPEALNFHYPSEVNRGYYEPYHDSTRIYVTFKRYFATENNTLKGLIYLPYAYMYAAARNFKYRGVRSFSETLNTFSMSLKFITDEFLTSSKY